MRYASGLSQHPHTPTALGEAAGALLDGLGDEQAELVLAFVSPHHADATSEITNALRELLRPEVLLFGTTIAVIGGATEVEAAPAVSLFAAAAPGVRIEPVELGVVQHEDGVALSGWPPETHWASTLVLLADPFTFPAEGFLAQLRAAHPRLRVVGGLASAGRTPGSNRLGVDDRVRTDGAVGVLLDAEFAVTSVVSQGCRPVGNPFVVTSATANRVEALAGAPAVDRLRETVETASDEERALLAGGLHVGIVVDEHRFEFARGDFLVRGVLGADRESGALALGTEVTVGQTVQFHVRDARSADEDLRVLLTGAEAEGALLFTCNGRGRHLFGTPDHDAGVVQEMVGSVPVAGGFFAGEFGPVGGRSYLHGFTASALLFA